MKPVYHNQIPAMRGYLPYRKTSKQGHSLVVSIPKELAEAWKLKEGDLFKVSIEKVSDLPIENTK